MNYGFDSGHSLIHETDPRVKLLFGVLFSFVIALSDQLSALGAALAFSVFLVLAARLSWIAVLRRLILLWGFLILLWAMLPLTIQGPPFYRLGPLTLTQTGVQTCILITIKSNAIFLIFISLISTMSFITLGYALYTFRTPDKLVHLLLLTHRYIFVIEQEYQRLKRAAKIRGFRPRTGLHTYKTYAYLVGMLFVRASARADRVHRAMKCRGFDGRFYCLKTFEFTVKDRIWSIFMTGSLAGLILLEWWGKRGGI